MKYLFRLAIVIVIFVLIVPGAASGQKFVLRGKIVDSNTGAPIENVNLQLQNSHAGVSTDAHGEFRMLLSKLPVTINITCIGYEPLVVDVTNQIQKMLELRLKPSVNQLETVTITDARVIPLYSDPVYSVLDYEIMDDKLLLMVFKYRLKRAELLLLSRYGDTIAQSSLPDSPPEKLYKDPLGNVHYLSKSGNAYQCFYDDALGLLGFPYKIATDSLTMYMKNLQFAVNDKLFFEESEPNGFSSRYGYFSSKTGKKYLGFTADAIGSRNYYSDLGYFSTAPRRSTESSNTAGEAMSLGFELFFKPKFAVKILKTGKDRITVIDLLSNAFEVRDTDWNLISKTRINFNRENKENFMTSLADAFSGDTWKWRWNLLTDDNSGEIYTIFERHGKQKLSRIDPTTGQIVAEFEIPLLFPKKLQIYKREAFFLYHEIGQDETWKLQKMSLRTSKK